MWILVRVFLVLFSYIVGSISTAYLAGRLKGIDLRRYGSGTVSGTAIWYHVSKPAIVPVGFFHLAKGALPVWLALRWGLGLPLALAANLAAVVGHNWPFYLGFKGGRGIGAFGGMLLLVFPQGAFWLLITLVLGRLPFYTGLGAYTGFGALVGLATLPILSWLTRQPTVVTWACGGMLLITVIKRLEANRLPLPLAGEERRRALMMRLLFDRDVGPQELWTERGEIM